MPYSPYAAELTALLRRDGAVVIDVSGNAFHGSAEWIEPGEMGGAGVRLYKVWRRGVPGIADGVMQIQVSENQAALSQAKYPAVQWDIRKSAAARDLAAAVRDAENAAREAAGRPMKTLPVDSSTIAGIGYDPDRRELRVSFKSGGVHDYLDVPPEAHSGLLAAPSHGSHFHAHIRGRYASRKAGGGLPMQDDPPETGPALPHDAQLDAAVRRFSGTGR